MKKAPSKPKRKKTPVNSGGRPLLFATVAELQTRIDEYFASCHEESWSYRMKPQYTRMKSAELEALGVPREDQFELVPNLDRHGNVVTVQVKPYAITALAAYLGTTRQTLLNYAEKDKFLDTIKNAKVKIEAYTEEQLYTPKIAAGVIFNLKNNYGYTDKIDHTSDGKALPQPIINVHRNNSDEKD